MVGKDARNRLRDSSRDRGGLDPNPRRAPTPLDAGGRPPRKRAPLTSYIPFAVAVGLILAIVAGMLLLVMSLAHDLTGGSRTATNRPPTQIHQAHGAVATSSRRPVDAGATSALTATPALAVSTAGTTSTPVRSLLGNGGSGMVITPGGPLPTSTPAPTATAIGDAGLVVAREVDLTGKAVEASTRFVSPSLRFYAVVTLHKVHSADQLHFIFEKDGVRLPGDDIQYQAGTDADAQSFSAWADYKGGTHTFPAGKYRILFYRNGVLEAVRTFTVG